jgi:acetyl-CoA C-acetyltransferase
LAQEKFMLKDIYLIDAVRTPIGKFGGSLKDIPASDLGVIVTKELLKRNEIGPGEIESVVLGNVSAAGDVHNAARHIVTYAGMQEDCGAHTVNRLCGSGMQAIISAIMEIETGNASISVAAGAENMSRIPYLLNQTRWGNKMGAFTAVDGMLEILSDPVDKYAAGILGENVAEKFKVSREEQDQFAYESQKKYLAATYEEKFASQIVPVEVGGKIGTFIKDEHPRQTSIEELAKLKPAFKKDGTVTAGNSSGINDGAAAVLLATKEKMDELDQVPLAKIISYAWSGMDHNLMGYAPVLSTKKALLRAKLSINDIGLIEINEAFAAQVLAVGKGLEWDPKRVNVNGGAIALGHPLGMSGVRIVTMLAHEMHRTNTKYGLATICIGGGMGLTLVLENFEEED